MKNIYPFIVFFLFPLFSMAQHATISGYVSDTKTGERLINATVFNSSTAKGCISNSYGFYSLTIPLGEYKLVYSYVGYQKQEVLIRLTKDTLLNVNLAEQATLGEITVKADGPGATLKSSQMSMNTLSMSTVESLPSLLGEKDVIKAIQLLPGVQSGAEGTSGFYVRGGGPDQNLILLDGVPVYNVDHLFGFFSVFNSDAINNVSLYKGGFPARFGGRLSSVLDIRMKEGNMKKIHGNISVGLISSKLNLEGPIIKDKTSFNISARRTYLDLLTSPIIKAVSKQTSGTTTDFRYYFYDLNAKINHKFSDRSRLFLSLYNGKDIAGGDSKEHYFNVNEEIWENDGFGIDWGNTTGALRWNYMITNKLFSNTTLTYSNYKFNVGQDSEKKSSYEGITEFYSTKYKSGIKDLSLKTDFDFYPHPDHQVRFGAGLIHHTFSPGVNALRELEADATAAVDTTYGNKRIRALELGIYAEDNFNLGSRFEVNAGLHISAFSVQDKFYTSLQPRLSVRYLATEKLSFKTAFSTMQQYVLLLNNSRISLPTDLWLPVTSKIKPQNSWQIAAGTVYDFGSGIDLSVEGFYKKMNNLIEYKEGASYFSAGEGWEDQVERGEGWSYGLEVLLRKTIGKTSGWIGYTWSKSERQFDNVNFGRVYPARYDRRHDISLVLTHKFSERFDVGMNWVFGTGNAFTLPTQNYQTIKVDGISYWSGNNVISHFDRRNNYRMPNYHRLDFSLNWHKQKKHGIRTWSLGLYNAYSRQNPFYVYYGRDEKVPVYKEGQQIAYKKALKQFSLFPLIPSITYSYKF